MGKKHIPLAVVAATAIALSSGQSAFAEGQQEQGQQQEQQQEQPQQSLPVYQGLSVISIGTEGIKVKLPSGVDTDKVANNIIAKDPDNKEYELVTTNKPASDYTVTYAFPSGAKLYGTWEIDSVKAPNAIKEVEAYKGLEVLRITKTSIKVKLPEKEIGNKALLISVKNPKGEEVEVIPPSEKIADPNTVEYKFAKELTAVDSGTWFVNTSAKYVVLSKEANEAKITAVQEKIKTAKTTLITNKNYVKNILAAQEAYEALTEDQKELFPQEGKTSKEMGYKDLEKLMEEITGNNGIYKPIQDFLEDLNELLKSTDFVEDFEKIETQYNALSKNQLSYLDAKIKKQYTSYLNQAAVQKGLTFDMSNLQGKANDIIDFNKAYKKLSKAEKEDILLDSVKKQKVTDLTDKTLQKNASAAATVEKKFLKLTEQKKDNKNKKLYYVIKDGKKTTEETTTKTAEPVMVPSLSAISKARTAYTTLQNKNPEAAKLVDVTTLEGLEGDDFVKDSIKRGKDFNSAVTAVAQATNFVEAFNKAKAAYIALTPDEQKYAIDKNALKQYKAYLKIDKVAVMYAKMTAPEQTTKSMKLAYDTSNTVSSITNDVKFSKGKFTIPKGNYEFTFNDGNNKKFAYYKDGKWTVADTLPELTKTIATAQEIYAYAKAFNALKDADEAILTKGPNGEVYKQYVGKENDYKKAAAVEKKIVSAVKSKRKATIASAQKAYDALTAAQQPLVTNLGDLSALQK